MRQLRGFTLVEVSISATLLLISTVVFYWGTINSLRYLDIVKRQTLALYACQNKMEEVRGMRLEELDALQDVSFADGKGKIVVVEVSNQMRRVEIEYQYSRDRDPIRLMTLVY